METTIKKTVDVKGYGMLEGEFFQNEEGWFCKEVLGTRWNYLEWGDQAPMETPEDAALYLLSLDIVEEDDS